MFLDRQKSYNRKKKTRIKTAISSKAINHNSIWNSKAKEKEKIDTQ